MGMIYANAWCTVEFIPREGAGEIFSVNCVDFPFITSVKVTKNLGMVAEIVIDIDMPFDVGMQFLNNELAPGVLFANTLVQVRMGYGDPYSESSKAPISEIFLGILNKGGMGLELTPTGLSGSITAVSVTPQAARLAASDNGLTLEQEFRKRVELAGYTLGFEVDPAARAVFDVLMKQPKNSIPFASNGAVRHIEYVDLLLFYSNLSWSQQSTTEGNRLTVQSLTSMSTLIKYRFVMRGGFDYDAQGNIKSYPIVSFAPEQKEVMFYAGTDPASLQAGSIEIDSKGNLVVRTITALEADIPRSIPSESAATPNPQSDNRGKKPGRGNRRGGTTTAVPTVVDRPMGRKEIGGLKEVPSPETPNLAEAMFAGLTVQASRFIPGITATLTTFGVPDIKPGIYVVVENVGALYQGTYSLNGVTHTWSGKEIESALTLRAYTPQVSDTVLPIIKLETNPSGAQ